MKFEVGQKVRFVGKESEHGVYHEDFKNVMHTTGEVVKVDPSDLLWPYEVLMDKTGQVMVFDDSELEEAE